MSKDPQKRSVFGLLGVVAALVLFVFLLGALIGLIYWTFFE